MNAACPAMVMDLRWLVIGVILTAAPCSAQSDDFDDNNADGWTALDPLGIASFSVSGGEYRISSPASPNPGVFGAARAASLRQDVVYSDFCMAVDIVNFDRSLSQAIGLMARVEANPGAGNTQGYTFTYQPVANDVQISRITGEQPTYISPAVVLPFSPGPGTTLRIVLSGRGSRLEGRIYDASDLLNPLGVAVADDSTYPAGTCGLVVSDVSSNSAGRADATFDNYSANDGTPPQLMIAGEPGGGQVVSWPDDTPCWRLQTSTTLANGSWTEVAGGINHDGGPGRFTFAVIPGVDGPVRFWRLESSDGP